MNKHILLVMKYLDDNSSVTARELLDNCKTADAAYVDATTEAFDATTEAFDADDYTTAYDYACAIASASATAAYNAYAVAAATCVDADDAAVNIAYLKSKIGRYFVYTGENKQDYLDEIAKNKGDK